MLDSHELVTLLQLAREEERLFASRLTADERAAVGTLEQPAPKDVLAHIAGAKEAMGAALVAAREAGDPDDAHDREALFHANCARRFEDIESDAERFGNGLIDEIERLDPATLASSPSWISEPTLGEEIVMYGATHSLTQLFEPLCKRGDAPDALRAQKRYLEALPDNASAELRAGALYNLGCLYARLGREDDALTSIRQAAALEPGLADVARGDPDLEPFRAQLP